MTLDQFLSEAGMSDVAFAREIDVSSEAVRRYRIGARIPDRGIMPRIVAATGGKVQPNDFFALPEAPTPEAAE